jgi:hypothetical protein
VLRWITPLTASDHSFAGLWDIPDIQMRHICLAAASNVRTIEGLPNSVLSRVISSISRQRSPRTRRRPLPGRWHYPILLIAL